MAVLIGIDVGTTNWKAAAFNEEGKPVVIRKTPTVTRYDQKGQGYYDPDEIWANVSNVIKQVVDACGSENIAAVSVASMAESVVPIDKKGRTYYPVIAWFDIRSRKQSQEVIDRFGRNNLFEMTGLDPNPIFSVPKIMWIRENEPEVYKKAYKWLQMSDYINWRLCGEFVTDYTLASRTLAFDIDNNKWSEEILGEMNIPKDTFPTILESGKVIGKVNNSASKLTGIPEGVPVVMGGHDHPCATIPTGVLLGRKILDSSGTAEAFLLVSGKGEKLPKENKGQRVCRYLDPSRYVLWGGIIASGASVDWGFKRFASVDEWGFEKIDYSYSSLMGKVEAVPPGSNGAMYLPHLRGSGAPYWDPRSKGAFLGLKSTHTSPELMRALFEGLSFQARMVVEMEENVAGYNVESLCTVGGGTRLRMWQQIKADITGKTIEIPEVEDATALGAAFLAGVGVGIYKDIEEASKAVSRYNKRIEPDIKNRDFYNKLYEIYSNAYYALVETNAKLDETFR